MWFNRAWRIGWTVATLVVVQVVVCAVAAMPAVLVWQWLLALAGPDPIVRLVAVSIALVPSVRRLRDVPRRGLADRRARGGMVDAGGCGDADRRP